MTAVSAPAPAVPPPVAPGALLRPPRGWRRWPLPVVAGGIALVFALPLGYLVVRAAEEGQAVWEHLVDPAALGPLLRSLVLATAVAAATAVLGLGLAWLVRRTDLPGARAWSLALTLPLALPSYIGAFTLRAAFAPGGLLERVLGIRPPPVEGFWAAFGVLTLLTYPYVLLVVAARLRRLPAGLEESARLLGRPPRAVFRAVVLPQVRGAVLAGSLLVFLYVVSDFAAVALLGYDTLTRAIFANLLDRPTSLAHSLQLAMLALLVVAAERAATARFGGDSTRAASGSRPLRVPLGRWRWVAVAAAGAVVGLALVAPLGVLAYWAVRGIAAGAGARASSVAADPGQLLAPLAGSVVSGTAAALVAVVAALPVAYLVARRRSRVAAVTNAVVVSGFALPGLVIAFSLVVATLSVPALAPLYASLPLLVLAYVVHFGAQAVRAAQVGVATLPPSVGDAARLLGAGPVRRFVAIELPLLSPPLLAGAGLVLLSAFKELPATLLLAPPGFTTLATEVWAATQDAFWGDASLRALVLVALSALLTWLVVLRRADGLA